MKSQSPESVRTRVFWKSQCSWPHQKSQYSSLCPGCCSTHFANKLNKVTSPKRNATDGNVQWFITKLTVWDSQYLSNLLPSPLPPFRLSSLFFPLLFLLLFFLFWGLFCSLINSIQIDCFRCLSVNGLRIKMLKMQKKKKRKKKDANCYKCLPNAVCRWWDLFCFVSWQIESL